MGERLTITLDDEHEATVLTRHRQTEKSKSKIINEMLSENGDETIVESFWSTLGQSLFVVGPILALFGVMAPGLGVMAFGLGLMLWGKMQTYMSARSVGPAAALRITLGM